MNALLLVAMFVVQAVLLLIRTEAIARVTATMSLHLRSRMLEYCQQSSGTSQWSVAEIQEVFTKHLQILENFFQWSGPRVVNFAVLGVPSFVLLFVVEWHLALLTFFCGVPMVLGPIVAARRYRKLAQMQINDQRVLGDTLHDVLTHRNIVRLFALETFWQDRFDKLARDAAIHDRMAIFWNGMAALFTMASTIFARLVVLVAGAWLVFSERSTVGAIIAFLTVLVNFVMSVNTIAESMPQVLQADESAARVRELLPRLENETAAHHGDGHAPPLQHSLQFESVRFGYDDGRPALDGISLQIAAGQRVAVVGPSGSGKSSLLRLLLGMNTPEFGAILWDGVNTSTFEPSSLLAQIGVVPQNAALFDLSIYENILMGRLDASRDDVIAAARAAELHESIEAMPQGYDTRVGPGGGNLSGGQRQRVALARALLRSPALLLLDEATSALDAKSEAAITDTLRRLGKKHTIVTVTHRLETIRDYDDIFVLRDGRVVEHGTHASLLGQGGLYAELFRHQVDDSNTRTHKPVPDFVEVG